MCLSEAFKGECSICSYLEQVMGFPSGSDGKKYTCQCRKHRFDLWVREMPEEGNGNPLQYPCMENPMDRGAWWATVPGVAKELDTT